MAVHRQERVQDEIRKVLAQAVQMEIQDPRIPPFTSITEVRVTRDFSYATCFVSILASDEEKRAALDGLESAKGFLRSKVAKSLRMRVTPELRFKLDETYDQAQKMDQLIDKAIGKEKQEE